MSNQRKIPSLYTVKQFCEKHPAFTHGGIKHHIFNASRKGLDEINAIVRNGRRVLIDETVFFEWLMNQ